jgi:deoxyribonuclease V
MQVRVSHRWDLSPREAAKLQLELRGRLQWKRVFGDIRAVAGADIAVEGKGERARGFAGVIVYSFPDLQEIERQSAVLPLRFPYVPGLLAFREGPVLLEALSKLRTEPDLLLFDAQGYAHPRRFGLASHLSLVLDTPGIGVAKSILVGRYEDPPDCVGAWTPLVDGGEIIGAALRTRAGVQPVYISVGHRIDLETAVELALRCADGYRVPKPTREADHFVEQLKRGEAPAPPQAQSSLF